MKLKYLDMVIERSSIKINKDDGTFECYGNVKGNIDHAQDRAMDGCYKKSIARHAKNGTMPKMFFNHEMWGLPVGKWLSWSEDKKGLLMKGKLSKTTMGRDIEILIEDGALDSFSIGYREIESKWNQEKGCNDLYELDIHEVSIVTFACNEESRLKQRLANIKSGLADGDLPTKRELQTLLREECGLSKSQAEKIVNKYQPDVDDSTLTDVELDDAIANMALFSQ